MNICVGICFIVQSSNLTAYNVITCEVVSPWEIEVYGPAEEAEWDGEEGAGNDAPVLEQEI